MKREAKYIATVSLGVMGAGFLATLPTPVSSTIWGTFLQGGFEAGVVGGLADWFAVSALFRHPLGIPIPHTALLPKNRERITKALVSTVENELLSKETIRVRLQQISFLERGLELAESQLDNVALHKGLSTLAKQAINAIDLDKLTPLLAEEIHKALQDVDSSRLVRTIVNSIVDGSYDGKTFDFVIDKVEAWAVKTDTRDQLGAMALKALEGLQSNGFMAFAVNAFIGMVNEEKIGGIIQNFVLSYIEQMRTKNHPRREAVLTFIRNELNKLERNPQLLAELEGLKAKLPGLFDIDEKLSGLLERLKAKAEEYVDQTDFVPQYVVPVIRKMLISVKENEDMLQRGESWIQEKIADYLEQNHSKIGQLVKENLDKLTGEKLTQLMEDKLGDDLQWIRVNGAICGFIIGLGLAGLKMLF
ncbi:DUF445 domain-containing protein [Paenibacillus alginolyticus]|uniref:DUF445 domain-containing protein n=1 Tax=Paenibacillus alginolyticus TaxID=59839 RepID=A0ABT4GGB2_9BACL|nr:DUF445 domain-containing protein [Paenibacillus alginolyticus]MCY9666920.1 DUF445 domain-containing protein [Paenibacillus alginolyticus]MCY9695224.1 DUF445 domain-containing protein [Paenibacillus alginolyticus]MEC0145181.1 DUF445 domain-containing protein [Paenibacillus alginolyticus]